MNTDNESPFYLEELFFSRTNLKGQIQSGNSVFQRVSGFTWDELESKTPIGAYVKNRSKDGRFYWVYALAFPIEEGFISIRLKPSTQILSLMIQEYSLLIEMEKNSSVLQSKQYLLQRITDLGFASYQEFACHSLIEELDGRHIKLYGQGLKKMSLLKVLRELNGKMSEIPKQILSAYHVISLTPLNLEITALNLGEVGRSIGVVASSYQKMVHDIEREIITFQRASYLLDKEIREASFLISSDDLIAEILGFFQKEECDRKNTEIELQYLQTLKLSYKNQSDFILIKVRTTIRDFKNLCQKLNSLIIALEVIRLTGRMEIGRLDSTHGLDVLLGDLKVFQTQVNESLRSLINFTEKIIETLDQIIESNSTHGCMK